VNAKHDDDASARESRVAGDAQRAYADALLVGDLVAAEAAIREAIQAGLAEAVIHDGVIRPALQLVGDLWADGHISVAQEHLATSITMRVLVLTREAFRLARQRTSQRVLLAGAQGEQHVVGLEMAASLLGHAGYDVRHFGADLPVTEIRNAVEMHKPVAIGFTTATVMTAINLPAAFDAAREGSPDIGIVVGGRAVNDRWAETLGVVVCSHVADAVEHVDAFVKRADRN
jgi:MerR family transcriptional regulator, light-induced transcriptional regulator